jgi:membrane protease YdiL (CAAX protease family)
MMPRIAPTRTAGGPPPDRREILRTWLLVVVAIGLAAAVGAVEPTGLVQANLAGIAALLFVLVPDQRLRANGQSWADHGVPWWGISDRRTWRAWAGGAAAGLLASAVVLPLFVAAVIGSARLAGHPVHLEPRLPPGLALAVAVQLLVVAGPEELFYRGWMQSAWARLGPARNVLGAPLGPGFVATQALFALGHLVTPDPWRLATFLPGLLFGWLRARTGGLAAPVVAHALSNLLVLFLRASLVPYR